MINKKYGISARQIGKYGFKLALEIYEKYNRKCSVCGDINYLAIHHIDGSGNTDHRNDDVDNLQLMCRVCHGRLHANKKWEKKQKEFGGYLETGRVKEYFKEYLIKNRERLREYQREYLKNKKNK